MTLYSSTILPFSEDSVPIADHMLHNSNPDSVTRIVRFVKQIVLIHVVSQYTQTASAAMGAYG